MSDHSEDEAAIRRYIEGVNEAFNRGDAKAIAATYAPDADYIDSLGRVSKGRADIEQTFQGFLTGLYQGAKLEGGIENIRFLTPTMALIDITGEATPQQGPSRRLRGVHVLVKQDGRWLSTAGRTWVPATVTV
jgi:uncharacterized protein (TIGR02246 family)